MAQIYSSTDEHLEVFTTVFSSKACSHTRMKHDPQQVKSERVVAVVDYKPHWSDELVLCQGDVIHVLYKDNEVWWFGRLKNGQQGYFPSAYVVTQNKINEEKCPSLQSPSRQSERLSVSDAHGFRTVKRKPSIFDKSEPSPIIISSLKRSFIHKPNTDVTEGRHCLKTQKNVKGDLVLALGPEATLPLTGSVSQNSPSILRKILMKNKWSGEYVGATNSAFESD
ncbi:vexin-like [Polyodon spathula]|uniref:vexin-like n=1 Tax=Polyodon spathula TaxID=7913 RepID=UPI001B7E5193|nr:vexin-like [Polyodon spathula]